MTSSPANTTFFATSSCVLLAATAAVALIVYAVLVLIGLVPLAVTAQNLVGPAL